MLSLRGLFWVGLSGLGLATASIATTAQAANQLYTIFDVSWSVKAFGNERTGGTGSSSMYSAVGLPQGIQCNPNQPRCPFESTPTDGQGNFAPLGGSFGHCAPWYNWGGNGTAERPAKGMTLMAGGPGKTPIPPLYRNPVFFTAGGAPGTTFCTATRTGFTPNGKGRVQAGNPVTASFFVANGTGGAKGGFSFSAAGASTGPGLRAIGVAGELAGLYPYQYSYTYATLRNDKGVFGPGNGPGSFNVKQLLGKNKVASINVKQGAAKFGGVMRMLGALTSKGCYYRNGGCSRGEFDWLYGRVGTAAPYTQGGVITKGYQARGSAFFYNTGLGQKSTLMIEGSRFPWTTGSVSVTAVGRGPHKTVHYARGYDNRSGIRSHYSRGAYLVGTLQLVTPVLTRWLQPAVNYETAGIGILRFAPEPHAWAMLATGISLLAVGYHMRGR